jgi:PPOX class probable F420-dependent enzyme
MNNWTKRLTIAALSICVLRLTGVLPAVPAVRAQTPPALQPTPPAMSAAELRAFLARPLVARLATVRPNGAPQIFPMWFLYEDGVLYMSTRTQAAKLRHIRHNARVAVAIDVMEAPLRNKAVIIDGTAEILTTGVKEIVTKIYQKYMGTEAASSPAAQRNINTPRVILKITPKKIRTMDTTGH